VDSFDSRDLLGGYGNTLSPTVAKSYSFGGYTATCTSHEANAAAMRGGDQVNGASGIYQQQHNVNTQHHGGQNYGTRFLSKSLQAAQYKRNTRVEPHSFLDAAFQVFELSQVLSGRPNTRPIRIPKNGIHLFL
jgi:hypothetical protein